MQGFLSSGTLDFHCTKNMLLTVRHIRLITTTWMSLFLLVTGCKIENHLIKNYNAVPYQLSEKRLEVLKANVIMTRFREVLVLPEPLGENLTKKQLLEYAQNDTSFEQARSYPAEKLGLIMKAYKLPPALDDRHEAIVELEMTSEYMSVSDDPMRKRFNHFTLTRFDLKHIL